MRQFVKAAEMVALACAGPLLVAIGDVPRQAPIDSHAIQSLSQRTFGTALGDVNGDDRLDALFAHGVAAGGFPNDVCPNRSEDRLFPTCTQLSSDRFLSGEVDLGDVDGDDDLDAVFANGGFARLPNTVCANQYGSFNPDRACESIGTTRRDSRDVALGDLDGDAHLDAVFANGGLQFGRERVCLNDGGLAGAACQAIGGAGE